MKYALCVCLMIALAGCGRYVPPGYQPGSTTIPLGGVYHKVKKGQTLWRIAKEYEVSMEKIAQVNDLADYTKLEVGQLVFIPAASQVRKVSVYRNAQKYQLANHGEAFIAPVNGNVSIAFGQDKGRVKNKGVDYRVPMQSKVKAARTGVVTYKHENLRGLGKVIFLDHQDGYLTVYAHLSDIAVSEGDLLKRGAVLGRTGVDPLNKQSALHFQVRRDGKSIDPLSLI